MQVIVDYEKVYGLTSVVDWGRYLDDSVVTVMKFSSETSKIQKIFTSNSTPLDLCYVEWFE